MDTLELCGDILQPGGQLETPGLVFLVLTDLKVSFLWSQLLTHLVLWSESSYTTSIKNFITVGEMTKYATMNFLISFRMEDQKGRIKFANSDSEESLHERSEEEEEMRAEVKESRVFPSTGTQNKPTIGSNIEFDSDSDSLSARDMWATQL